MKNYKLPQLPLDFDLETNAIMKKTSAALSSLAEMKGSALSIPNESILISTLSLQKASTCQQNFQVSPFITHSSSFIVQ